MGKGRHGRKSPAGGCALVLNLVLSPSQHPRAESWSPGCTGVGMGRRGRGVGCCRCCFLLIERRLVGYTQDVLQSLLMTGPD